MYPSSVLLLGLFSSSISALALNAAVVTAGSNPNEVLSGLSMPEPTPGPNQDELRRRQDSQRTLLLAPDNTCGYFGGSSGAPWGCSTGHCAFVSATAIDPNNTQTRTAGNVLCCDPTAGCPAAPAPTACVDRGRYDYNQTCTGNCSSDPMTMKCTSGIYLYCNTVTFPAETISAFFCNYLSTYDIMTAQTKFAGQGEHSFTPAILQIATTAAPSTSGPASTTISAHFGTSTSKRRTSASATPTAEPAAAKPPNPHKKAIIGGVVGGVAGLVLIAAAIWWFIRWRNTPYPAEDKKGSASTSQEKVAKPGSAGSATPGVKTTVSAAA